MLRALEGGALCALGTALGAVPVLVIRNMPVALADTLLGFGAGVMLAATAFSLIVPGIAAAESLGLTPWAASGLICFGIMLGAIGLFLVDRQVAGATPEMLVGTPEHPVIPPRIWLFVFAIIAHNIPEGMAVGVSAGGGMPDADSLAMGIALQDVPEGLVIALVLAGAGMSRFKAFLIGAASGLVEPVADVHLPPSNTPPPEDSDGRPSWAVEPFECLLFDVAGLTLAVPLVCLGSIYSLAGHELTPLFGQPEWFLGILPSQAGNLKVLDTARWVMPDRYRDDFRQGLQYVISVQGYEWGLAVHQVSRSLRLNPNEIKWRSHRGQRPWLAGTVIEHMCALLDVAQLAELIASGGAKHLGAGKSLHSLP